MVKTLRYKNVSTLIKCFEEKVAKFFKNTLVTFKQLKSHLSFIIYKVIV